MPGDFWEGQNHFSLLVQTTLWLAVLSGDESKAWHGQGTCQVLPCIRSILFLPVLSKPSRMRVFTVDSLLSMGRKAKVGRRSWGFLLFLWNRPEDCCAYGIPLREPLLTSEAQVETLHEEQSQSSSMFWPCFCKNSLQSEWRIDERKPNLFWFHV